MKEPYLEVTFRHGRPIAAYYYLPRQANQRVCGLVGSSLGWWRNKLRQSFDPFRAKWEESPSRLKRFPVQRGRPIPSAANPWKRNLG